ncbi:MAG: glycerol-3-phosphate dehydrogenase [Natronospirillum sp.]|uniref:glycerol-3-phosphate dehydrogenase n=1 Tax=Natronospirillum sp. TaxID=2812955 RepID=UPI0025DAE762|nr:glycerol-3-phosphate dehydrogenase [Natronospirillum sp.]MCH8551489.1 glycerol-3-phosphate dehydrogenase [Natronospirillum sp.]
MAQQTYDLLVIGGGINGAGVAADAAGRGLSVALCETDDLASATSSWSSKLIHGGLRYLEHYEFRLVREALGEREVLLRVAPHLVTPLRFRMPHHKGLRPAWMIRIGLFLYDHLSKRTSIKGSKGIRFDPQGPVRPEYVKGFEYSDCRADDARLVVMNAKLAEQKGATIMTRHSVTRARRENGVWAVTVQPQAGNSFTLYAKALVNAGGPWVRKVLDSFDNVRIDKTIRLVKGSHIIVPRIHDEEEAYILQNSDGRIVFVLPYLEDYSLIGTTDVDYHGDPRNPEIDDDEIDYLIRITEDYFRCKLGRKDIVWTYSGVRPLMQGERPDEEENASKVSRDYHFEVEDDNGHAPLLSIFGGKLTTYRKLSQAAVSALKPWFPGMSEPWTDKALLPGGENMSHPASYAEELQKRYPFLTPKAARRLAFSYGRLAERWLGDATSEADLGPRFGQLYGEEVRYLMAHEWAETPDDVIWRRTKTGIGMTKDRRQALAEFMAEQSTASESKQSHVVNA